MIDNELNQAFHLVSQHNNAQIKEGEARLAQLKKNCNYPMGLLIYMNNNQALEAQLRAAIELKLWCQSYNNLEAFERKFYESVIEQVKEKIVIAYLVFETKISQTLRPAIVALTKAEFPRNWQALIPGLIQYATLNSNSIHSVLLLIQDITAKYSILSRSDPLYEEIILVCDQTHDFLLDLTMKIIQSPNLDARTLGILETLMNIFYHLNYQDLHPKFEDNLGNWMGILKQVMMFANQSEEVFKCKGAALQSILLYANKYKEDVQEAIKGFSSQIWELCSNATENSEYDSIVFNCLKYFKSIVMWSEMKQFFIDNLGQLIEKLIMPNLRLNKTVMEMFHDEPSTFFDFYFKNNEIHTRRAASLDLLRVICRNFPNFQAYVLLKIQQFTSNMVNASVQDKCNLLNFIIDAATKSFRDVDGCTQTYISQSIIAQCYEHIVYSDLGQIYNWILSNQTKMIQDAINKTLLITSLRYCFFFRIFIPTSNYQLIIKFSSSINTNNQSIKTLLYMVINAFLTVRHGDFMHFKNLIPHFNSQNSQEIAKDVLQTIYKNDTTSKQLNDHLTRMLYTLAKILGQSCVQYYDYFDALFPQMLAKTQQYDFKSVLFLFEAIGLVAYWVSKCNNEQGKQKLETQIVNYLQVIVKRKSDLLNFCFQILAIFLEFQNKQADKHKAIYESILNLENWTQDNITIMSSYIQYISAYLNRSSANLVSDMQKFQVILSRLIELQHYELFFRFLDSILRITNIDQFYSSGYFKLSILGTQAVVQKSILGKKVAVLFIFKLMTHHDLNKVLTYMNNVSPNLFQNLITNSDDIIRTMQFRRDRKLMYAALCKVISLGVLQPQIQGSLLSLLIENSTNRFQMVNLKESIEVRNQSQKKQSTYQKLQVFNLMETKQTTLQIDEEQELCKTYIICQNNKRVSLNVLSEKNHERINKLKDKHSQTLNNIFLGNQGGNRIF